MRRMKYSLLLLALILCTSAAQSQAQDDACEDIGLLVNNPNQATYMTPVKVGLGPTSADPVHTLTLSRTFGNASNDVIWLNLGLTIDSVRNKEGLKGLYLLFADGSTYRYDDYARKAHRHPVFSGKSLVAASVAIDKRLRALLLQSTIVKMGIGDVTIQPNEETVSHLAAWLTCLANKPVPERFSKR